MGGGQATTIQENFRIGNDDGSESGHGWIKALNTDATAGETGADINDGEQIFLRFTIANTGGKSEDGFIPDIRVSKNGGSYALVGATGAFKYATNATYLTDGNDTTDRLSGTGTFDTTNAGVIEGTNVGASNNLVNGTRQEVLVVLEYDFAADTAGTNTYDFQITNNGTDLDGYTQTPRITSTVPYTYTGVIKTIDFEEGDLTDWDLGAAAGAAATTGAALVGTYGMECDIDGAATDEDGATDLSTAHATDQYRFRFYFDPNSISMANGDWIMLQRIQITGGTTEQWIDLGYNGSSYTLELNINDDGGTNQGPSAVTISDAPHYVEVSVTGSSTADANDGSFSWWIDGVSQTGGSSLDLYDVVLNTIEFGGGNVNVSGTTFTGTIYVDDFVIRDDNTEIGAAATGITGTFSNSIGNITISSTAELDVEGTASASIGNITISSTAELDIAGTATNSIGNITLTAEGSETTSPITGTFSNSIGDITLTTDADLVITGTATNSIGSVGVSSTGELDIAGTATNSIGDITLASTGAVDIAGSATITIDEITTTTAAELDIAGTFSNSIGDLTLEAAGTSQSVIIGSASITVDDITATIDGTVDIAGAFNNSIGSIGFTGSSTVDIAGSGNIAIEDITLASTSELDIAAQVSLIIDQITAETSGSLLITGTATNSIGNITLSAASTIQTPVTVAIAKLILSEAEVYIVALSESKVYELILSEGIVYGVTLAESKADELILSEGIVYSLVTGEFEL